MTPGRLFSITTSASRINCAATRPSSGSFKFKTTDFLLRLREAKFSLKPLLMGGHWRKASPSGGSTFTTSAPMSARSCPQNGPDATEQNSTTFTPESGAAALLASVMGCLHLRVDSGQPLYPTYNRAP